MHACIRSGATKRSETLKMTRQTLCLSHSSWAIVLLCILVIRFSVLQCYSQILPKPVCSLQAKSFVPFIDSIQGFHLRIIIQFKNG